MDKAFNIGEILSPEKIAALKAFLLFVGSAPELLLRPELTFLKEFIESFGGKIPTPSSKPKTATEEKPAEQKSEPAEASDSDSEEIEESDVELDNAGVIDNPDPITDEDVDNVPLSNEVDEDASEKANEKKREGLSLYSEGEYEKAVKVFTDAIELNPSMSLLYAKRGQCYLQLKKPNACMRDCTRALKINPDNAAAYKFRGRAHRLLGNWLEAARDLRSASKIDFDEQVDEWLKEITPNVRKLEEHIRRYERLRFERELKQKRKRNKKIQEEREKAANSNAGNTANSNFGAGPNLGGKGDLPPEFMDFFMDPEIKKYMEDPEVLEAFTDVSSNPANMMKYVMNPKIMGLINKLDTKFKGKGIPSGLAGMFSGAGGGFPKFGGPPGSGAPPAPPTGGSVPDDIGLD